MSTMNCQSRSCCAAPHDEMVIEDLSEDEGAAFLATVES
jgi:hypothetical protein